MSFKDNISKKNKYYIPKERYLELKHFCRQYYDWKRELSFLENLGYERNTINERVQTSIILDPTKDIAIKIYQLKKKIEMVEEAAYKADKELCSLFIFGAATSSGYDYMSLIKNIPCCRDVYYKTLRKFYYYLSQIKD